jgi:hypothetical protein
MNRKFTFLGLFVLISILMGYPMYYQVLEGEFKEGFALFIATYLVSSVLLYAVYTGRIKTGASVALREKYSTKMGHSPMTRDEEMLNQLGAFLKGLDSIVRDEDLEQ